MKPMSKQILNLFFNPGESICVSHNEYAYHSISQDSLDNDKITLVSNNVDIKPVDIEEKDITLMSVNPIRGNRNDKNVTAFRSFLIEIDEGSLSDQFNYIEQLGLPYSVCVFSGNKSMHFGLVLEESYPSISIWKFVNQWILNIIEKADQQTKNPSRCIRFPGNIRISTGNTQYLIKINGRVKNSELNKWLESHKDKQPKITKRVARFNPKIILSEFDLPSWVRDYYNNGVATERNVTWFKIACWFARSTNLDEEKFIDFWSPVFIEESDFRYSEWISAIKSAFKTVQEGDSEDIKSYG